MTLPGIDVSGYQTTTPTLTGLSFCIAKASEGLYASPQYPMHLANIRAAGIVSGAYHFARSDVSTPAEQAAFFLKTAGDVDLYALDVEGTHAFSLAQSEAFIAAMHAAGKRIGMYHSLSGFPHVGQDWDWVAYYNPTAPTIHWDIWQYGSRYIDGKAIDGDTFHGDAAALAALVGGTSGGINVPGGDMRFISGGGLNYSSGYVVQAPVGTVIRYLDGTPMYTTTALATYPYLGLADGHTGNLVVGAHVKQPYADGVSRETAVLIQAALVPSLVPPPAPSGFTQADLDAATLAGQRHEWDREFTGTSGAKVTPLARP